MSFGKSGSTNTTIPTLSPEQNAMIAAQTGLFTSQIAPSYATAVQGATDLYNQSAPGVTNAAQNLAGVAGQAQNTLGSTGESALRTGIAGLESLYDPGYEQRQLNAAFVPAQLQYQQNLANQAAQYGAAGQLGSARSALAQTALAGQTQASQQAAAAQIEKDIAAQRMQAGTTLAGLGQGGIGQAIGAAGQGVTAAMSPQQLYNQYSSVLFGTPSASYNPNFSGTQGQTSTGTKTSFGISI
jgi:hypothetical protein